MSVDPTKSNGMDLSWLGRPHEYDPGRLYSQTGADWQYRVDFDRLRRERLVKLQAEMKAEGLGALVLVGGFMAAIYTELIVMPTKEAPGVPAGMAWVLGLVLTSIVVALAAWPRLSVALLVYAILARIPVVAITFLAVANGWDTHYDKLAPNFAVPAGESKAMFLAMPQFTFWIAFTVLIGGVFGCLGAALARRKS